MIHEYVHCYCNLFFQYSYTKCAQNFLHKKFETRSNYSDIHISIKLKSRPSVCLSVTSITRLGLLVLSH